MNKVISKFNIYEDGDHIGVLERSEEGLFRYTRVGEKPLNCITRLFVSNNHPDDFSIIAFFNARVPSIDKEGIDEYIDHGTGIVFKRIRKEI